MATVDTLINDGRGYAASIIGTAVARLNEAIGVANGLGRTIGGADLPTINIAPPVPRAPGDVPVNASEAFRDPGFTARDPVLRDVPNLDLSGQPGRVPSVLGFEDPRTQPTGNPGDPALLQNPPEIDAADLDLPVAPDLLSAIRGIPKPNIRPINVPDSPGYREPAFLGRSPGAAPAAPTGLDTTLRTAYADIAPVMREAVVSQVDAFINAQFPAYRTGLAKIEERLATYLEGGTALTPAVQDQLFQRAASKADAEYRRNAQQVATTATKMGHTLIGATLFAKLQEAQNDRHSTNAAVARDLMIQLAKMEQDNLQFAVTQSANLRSVMINAAMSYAGNLVQINGQALDYARSVVDTIVKIYDVAARQKELEARIYEAEANVYQAKVRGALGAIEAYSAEVRGLEAQANVDTAMVNALKAQIEAVTAEATVYRAEVDGKLAKAQMARALVDIYQARVQAFGQQVNAWTAQWQGYRYAVEGQVAGINASVEQVRGYQAEASSWEAIIRARTAQIEGIVKANDGLLRQQGQRVEVYKALVGARSEVQKAQLANFDSTTRAFVAQANADAEHDRAKIAHYEAGLRSVVANFEMLFRLLHEGHELDVERVKSISTLSSAIANAYAGLAQSSASGLNTLVAQVAQE